MFKFIRRLSNTVLLKDIMVVLEGDTSRLGDNVLFSESLDITPDGVLYFKSKIKRNSLPSIVMMKEGFVFKVDNYDKKRNIIIVKI